MSSSDSLIAAALALSPQHRGAKLCLVPEDQWFDRKSVRISPTKLAEGIVAFANAEGGTILIGLSDGKVEGTDSHVQHRNDLIQAAIDHTAPLVRTQHELIECRNHRGDIDHLLAIHVASSEGVHATGADHVFLRVGDESRRLNFVQRQELLYDKGQAHFDGSLSGFKRWMQHRFVGVRVGVR